MLDRLRRARGDRSDAGFTLVELLVAMSLFSILLAVFGSAAAIMFNDVRKQQGLAQNADEARKALQLIDKQVRYANAINTPVAGPAGAFYVEFQQGDHEQRQTCVQWRLTSAGALQYRTWQPVRLVGDVLGTTAWSTRASGIFAPVDDPATAEVEQSQVFALTGNVDAAYASRQQLRVAFRARHGAPAVERASQVTLTALNTTVSTGVAGPPAVPVCQEVPR